jgi:hypothetical protein
VTYVDRAGRPGDRKLLAHREGERKTQATPVSCLSALPHKNRAAHTNKSPNEHQRASSNVHELTNKAPNEQPQRARTHSPRGARSPREGAHKSPKEVDCARRNELDRRRDRGLLGEAGGRALRCALCKHSPTGCCLHRGAVVCAGVLMMWSGMAVLARVRQAPRVLLLLRARSLAPLTRHCACFRHRWI